MIMCYKKYRSIIYTYNWDFPNSNTYHHNKNTCQSIGDNHALYHYNNTINQQVPLQNLDIICWFIVVSIIMIMYCQI